MNNLPKHHGAGPPEARDPISGVARVWAARAAFEFGTPEAHKNMYCTVTRS